MGRDLSHRQGATPEELSSARTDVLTGMFASNAIMYLHHPHDGRDAARARTDEHRDGRAGGGSAASRGRRRRLLAVHDWTHRHGHAGRSGAGGIVRVRDRRSLGVARIARSKTLAGQAVLRRARVLGGAGDRAHLYRARRHQAAVHDGRHQRRARPAAHPDRPAADERPDGHGRRRQLPLRCRLLGWIAFARDGRRRALGSSVACRSSAESRCSRSVVTLE